MEKQISLALASDASPALAQAPGSAPRWRGIRVAFRLPEEDPKYRALCRRHGDGWHFTWARGVVISEPKDGMVEVADGSRHRAIMRLKLKRLACHACCGHGVVLCGKPGTENPVEVEEVQCLECVRLPRPGLRWAHPMDDHGECNDTDPTGEWKERYRRRMEAFNAEQARRRALKQNPSGEPHRQPEKPQS